MFVDLVFLGDFCNLTCIYCSSGRTRWKRVGSTLEGVREKGGRTRVDLDALEHDVMSLLDRLVDECVAGVKISGGEIFVAPRLAARVIEGACERFPLVQVLTNGIRVDELLALAVAHDNLSVQVSLDGADAATNRARGGTATVWRNLGALAERIPLEVNTVLTRYNTAKLPEFLSKLIALGRSAAGGAVRPNAPGDIVVYPFPVRGGEYADVHPVTTAALGPFLLDEAACTELSSRPADWVGVDTVLDRYSDFDAVLPPRAYLEALRRFLRHGNRRGHCEIPHAITGVNQDGVQAVCPCADLGVFGRFDDGLHHPARPLWEAPCAGCFTHYEIIHCADDVADVRGPFTRALVEHSRVAIGR